MCAGHAASRDAPVGAFTAPQLPSPDVRSAVAGELRAASPVIVTAAASGDTSTAMLDDCPKSEDVEGHGQHTLPAALRAPATVHADASPRPQAPANASRDSAPGASGSAIECAEAARAAASAGDQSPTTRPQHNGVARASPLPDPACREAHTRHLLSNTVQGSVAAVCGTPASLSLFVQGAFSGA